MSWALAALISGGALFGMGMILAVYLDLRLHALKQSGDLPAETPQLFGLGWWGGSGGFALDADILYSRRFREIDDHTRRLAPIIRVALPTGFLVGAFGMVLVGRA